MYSAIRFRESLSALSLACAFCLCAGAASGQEEPETSADATPAADEVPPEPGPDSTPAAADVPLSVDACLAAHASSQELRQNGSLLESRQHRPEPRNQEGKHKCPTSKNS